MTVALPPNRVIRKPLTVPFLVALTVLWLVCLPLYSVSLPLVGIRHPAAALSLLTLAFTLGFAGLEVIRQHTWRASRLTGTLGIATGLTMIPYFYPQALGHNSGYALTALALAWVFSRPYNNSFLITPNDKIY
ncbi:hypothetical protein [Salinivibrio socompensis]|uniref:hypothetical protein n=1 Tax=Salinivibrio socompensis TaxID=1510206 RepID=UPI00046F291A|nr:hypothetical protein [Salinivibrio socompensis]